ncbi:MAG: succinylglutamate desuccinylase/aspartoacylase family protein [Candidatus Aminicenantes bacterium]|nr:succinylglutamate desuccinylase/aspartoacylase family protein [Candidatus Aminicenantes bacterium]
MSVRTRYALTLMSCLALCATAWAGEDFVIAGARIGPGTAASGFLAVPPGPGGPGTEIPYTVIHGAGSGPTLALVAGVHAVEYPPILALYRLKAMIDPKTLKGTVLMVHIANLPSFKRRTIYYGPDDWKNLNRVFPGDIGGTTSQRIAAVLNEEVVQRADVLVDMHCGDGNEALIPYTYWMISGDEAFDAKTKALALAFGIPHIIIDDTRGHDLKESKYLGNTAILQGKPAITTEAGFLGGVDEASIVRNVRGVLGVLRHLGMIAGRPEPVDDPVWIDKYEVVYSKHDGLFAPRVEMGYFVRAGQVVGTITDYLGAWAEDVRAPFTGILLYVVGTPPCNAGEPLFEVGRVREK